jgi:UDP-N-acetylmuramoylalanine--D-glutamate ligase
VGLARSGLAAAQLLLARGEEVIGADAQDVTAEAGFEVHGRSDGVALLERVRAVVKSPGVPPSAPVIVAARDRGLPVLGEVELAWRCLPNEVIAVTGTNGKTTVAELLGHLHRAADLPVEVAGNVGAPYSAVDAGPSVPIVLEASSFQLADTLEFAPAAAVLLNLADDHRDWHGSLVAYHAAKLLVFARQGNDDIAVAPSGLGIEDLGGCARRVCFGERPDDDVSLRSGTLWWDGEPIVAVDELRIRGDHNVRNAMAAAAAALARGIHLDAVREGLRSFAGVPHRLEEVGTRDGVLYVNDSKATNVASTRVALAAFPGRHVHLILGGQAKGQDLRPLRDSGYHAAYLIGEASSELAAVLSGDVRVCGTLERAVGAATAAARPGDVVLLSPACASFDQFESFEARGQAFRELVAN